MITRASILDMRVGTFSRRLRGVAVLRMPGAGLDSMQHVQSAFEVAAGEGVG
jgi:hypothetical protein